MARCPALDRCADAVHGERLGDDLADGHARVERRVRVLEDELHLAAERLEGLALEREHIGPVELMEPARRLEKPDEAPPGRRLAATGLTHQSERLAASTVNETPSTACTFLLELGGDQMPCSTGKYLTSSRRAAARTSRHLRSSRRRLVAPRTIGLRRRSGTPASARARSRAARAPRSCTRSFAYGHRGWNAQPDGTSIRLGGWPSMGQQRRPSRRCRAAGRLSSSPHV